MNKYFITILLFAFVFSAFGQRNIEVKGTSHSFSTGNNDALSVVIYESTPKDVSKAWQKQLKDFNGKTSEKKGEVFSDNAIIKKFGDNNAVDIYTRFEETGEGNTTMFVAVDLGGAYLSSSQKEKYNVMKDIIHDFAKEASQDVVSQQIKDATKVFSGLESDQKQLVKDNENLHSDIESYKDKITKAEDAIKKNEEDQEAKKKEIEDQQKVLDDLNEKLKGIK